MRNAPRMRARGTQVLGLCFYWAWVYLSFNTTTSMNWDIGGSHALLWVHLTSTFVGAASYLAVILFSRRGAQLLKSRAVLYAAGIIMAAGSALSSTSQILGNTGLAVAGGALTGISSCWVLLKWGALYGEFSARTIVISTACSFFAAGLIYYGVSFFSFEIRSIVVTVLPLCAVFLFPDPGKMLKYWGEEGTTRTDADTVNATDSVDSKQSGSRTIFPISKLPWRIGVGLFIIMFVYGGVRVLLGTLDTTATDQSGLTILTVSIVCIIVAIWGLLFQGNYASLGTVYKFALPLLATTLLMIIIFGQTYAPSLSLFATACNVTIEILSWILLADLARTGKTPAFLTFAVGRMGVQAGMACGQAVGWMFFDWMQIFAIVSIFALMLVMGFMFEGDDGVLVFEAPTADELDSLPVDAGRSLEDHLKSIASAHELTPRETEIFVLWATGHGSKYIQDHFVISPATVKTHVRHIYEKCDVHSRAEIIALLEDRQPR